MAFYRFLDFELDPSRYELRRKGRNLRLEKIPQDLLILLVEKKGDLITREEIIERIWGKDVFVDSEAGINTAIRKIRQTLHDDPENPRLIQTVVGRGYRFLAPVTLVGESSAGLNEGSTITATLEKPVAANLRSGSSRIIWTAASLLVVFSLALLGANVRGWRDWLLGRSRPVAIH